MRLSLVIPCYNEQEALPLTVAALEPLMRDLVARGKISPDSNIWFVDDGSRDQTWPVIEGLTRRSPLFVGVKLSRNRGHQNALLAGLMNADGEAVISLDADLQDDIAVIDEIYLPGDLFQGLNLEVLQDWNGSLYSLFETRFGMRMIRAQERIRAVAADRSAAEVLKVAEGTSLLSVERVTYTYGDKPVEWRRGLYSTAEHFYLNELN